MADDLTRSRIEPVDDPDVIARVVAVLTAHRPQRHATSAPDREAA